jgi:hypothetical protein
MERLTVLGLDVCPRAALLGTHCAVERAWLLRLRRFTWMVSGIVERNTV